RRLPCPLQDFDQIPIGDERVAVAGKPRHATAKQATVRIMEVDRRDDTGAQSARPCAANISSGDQQQRDQSAKPVSKREIGAGHADGSLLARRGVLVQTAMDKVRELKSVRRVIEIFLAGRLACRADSGGTRRLLKD